MYGPSYPRLRPGVAAGMSCPTPEARGGQDERPHVQGAVATWVPERLEELFHVQIREGRR